MKKRFLLVVAAVVIVMGAAFVVHAQMGPGMMGRGHMWGPGGGYGGYGYEGFEGWYCPYCGRHMGPGHGMGPGYGRGPGYGPGWGMGPGMMGPGHMYGPGMMQPGYPHGPRYGAPRYEEKYEPLKEKDVKAMLDDYLKNSRNPNLKVGKITEKNGYFEAEILTKNDSLVDQLLVDKYTGWMKSMY